MTTVLPVFQELIQRYPTWCELEAFLESEEGGRFRMVETEGSLCLIRYEKGVSAMDLPHSMWFRSVVWDTVAHRPVCMAPPKTSREPLPQGEPLCQEWMEGFMINTFKRAGEDTWHITSRSRLQASGRFYSKKSFRHLFMEAYTGRTLEENELEACIQEEGKNVPGPAPGESAVFMSFLVQHTEHRIVQLFQENHVWGILKGVVGEDGCIQMDDCPTHDGPWLWKTPMLFSSDNLSFWIHQQLSTAPWTVQGFVLKSEGKRWRFPSASYAAVKSLRGNTPYSLERFVTLYQQNLTQTYLQYYREDTTVFAFHQESMMRLVEWIHLQYVHLHVRKTCALSNIDKMFHPHLYALHGHYLNHLRESKQKLLLSHVHQYLREQPWQRVAFLLRRMEDEYLDMVRDLNVPIVERQ